MGARRGTARWPYVSADPIQDLTPQIVILVSLMIKSVGVECNLPKLKLLCLPYMTQKTVKREPSSWCLLQHTFAPASHGSCFLGVGTVLSIEYWLHVQEPL